MKVEKTNIQEPYYSLILQGKKTVGGRLNKGKFLNLKIGDILKINNEVEFILINKKEYSSFRDMILREGVENIIPDEKTIDEAVEVCRNFYSLEDEKRYGVVALKIKKLD